MGDNPKLAKAVKDLRDMGWESGGFVKKPHWTEDPPTQPGWYWVLKNPDQREAMWFTGQGVFLRIDTTRRYQMSDFYKRWSVSLDPPPIPQYTP